MYVKDFLSNPNSLVATVRSVFFLIACCGTSVLPLPSSRSLGAQRTSTWLSPTSVCSGFQNCRFSSSWTTVSIGSDHRSRFGPCWPEYQAEWNTGCSVQPCLGSLQALKWRYKSETCWVQHITRKLEAQDYFVSLMFSNSIHSIKHLRLIQSHATAV